MRALIAFALVFAFATVAFGQETFECPKLKFNANWQIKSTANHVYPVSLTKAEFDPTMTDSVFGTCHQGYAYHTMSCKVGDTVVVKKRICGKNCKLADNKLTCEHVRQ